MLATRPIGERQLFSKLYLAGTRINRMPSVSLIIPNWNGRHLLPECLHALASQTFADFEIILIDNASQDGSVEWAQTCYPRIHVYKNASNRGFAYAVNQGISLSNAPYIVTLNNDTKPETTWLTDLVKAAESDACVGMCASKMLFVEPPNVINSAGICVDRAGFAWDRDGGKLDDDPRTDWSDVFGPSAGAALYKHEMLKQIGVFDEDFFAYLEDVDLAWRAQCAGWRCLYVPTARVYHHHSATSVEGSPFKSYHLGRNKVWLLAKNYPFRELGFDIPIILLYDVFTVLYALLIRHDIQALRGRLAGLASIRQPWSKRLKTQQKRADVDWLLPVSAPWNVLKRYKHLKPRIS
jgi:GT2 family glycosyltransferase